MGRIVSGLRQTRDCKEPRAIMQRIGNGYGDGSFRPKRLFWSISLISFFTSFLLSLTLHFTFYLDFYFCFLLTFLLAGGFSYKHKSVGLGLL